MRKLFIFIILVPFSLVAQNILLVNDNDFILRNTDTLINDFNKLNLYFDVYDIESNAGLPPDFSEMDLYDLIVWYTSSDKDGLKFWTASSETNIKKFIDKGKIFWIIGLDFIEDKYGSPPKDFSNSDLLYEYFGINKYAVQSYEDDDFKGCSQLDKAMSSFAGFPSKILWNLPLVWWIDGCEILPQARPVYYMGPSSYKLAGSISMFIFQNDKKKTMTTLFDPVAIDSEPNRLKFLQSSFDFMDLLAEQSNINNSEVEISPNPAINKLFLDSKEKITEIHLYDLNGIRQSMEISNHILDISHLPQGQYLLKIIISNRALVIKKFVKL